MGVASSVKPYSVNGFDHIPGFIDQNTYTYEMEPDGSAGELKQVVEFKKEKQEPEPLPLQEKTCPHCHEVFSTTSKKMVYCSVKCSRRAWEERNRKPAGKPEIERVCVVCGIVFTTTHSTKKCCSDGCRIINTENKNKERLKKKREERRARKGVAM